MVFFPQVEILPWNRCPSHLPWPSKLKYCYSQTCLSHAASDFFISSYCSLLLTFPFSYVPLLPVTYFSFKTQEIIFYYFLHLLIHYIEICDIFPWVFTVIARKWHLTLPVACLYICTCWRSLPYLWQNVSCLKATLSLPSPGCVLHSPLRLSPENYTFTNPSSPFLELRLFESRARVSSTTIPITKEVVAFGASLLGLEFQLHP